MKINGRFLLVLCAMALFMRIWSVNDRPRKPAAPRIPAAAARSAAPMLSQPGDANRELSVIQQVPVKPASISDQLPGQERIAEVWTETTVPFDLPAGLAAGIYRAVSDTGRVARLTIESTKSRENSGVELDILSICAEGVRWYLIRLKSEEASPRQAVREQVRETSAIVPDPVEILVPPYRNPKFGFSGFRLTIGDELTAAIQLPGDASEIEVPASLPATSPVAIEQAERPAPPELPSPF